MQELLMFMYHLTPEQAASGFGHRHVPGTDGGRHGGTADLAGQQGRVRWFGSMVRPCSP